MTRFISRLWASTRRQGAQGLGIEEGKREAIARHFAGHGGAVPAELVQAESDREDACPRLAAPNARGPPSPSGRGHGTAAPWTRFRAGWRLQHERQGSGH